MKLVTKHGLYWSLRALHERRGGSMPSYLPETYHVIPEGGEARGEDPRKVAVQKTQTMIVPIATIVSNSCHL